MRVMPSWSPLLPARLREPALRAVDDLAVDLRRWAFDPSRTLPSLAFRTPGRDFSLAGGDAGIALFFAYLDRAFPGCGHGEVATELLERAVEGMGAVQATPGLYSGFCGVAWVLEHLREQLFAIDDEDPGEDVAAALESHLGETSWSGSYDLISGLAGFGVYALERQPRPGGMGCLERVAARLAGSAERPAGAATWRTPREWLRSDLREQFPQGNYNLGVAHGVPGVIALLGEASAVDLEVRTLLDGAVSWLLEQRLPPGVGSAFPSTVAPGFAPAASRLAWCYGDPGVAAALLGTARRMGNALWEEEAREIARHAAVRLPERSGVVDAGLCHGAAGLAHLFDRIHQATGEPVFADAACGWVERTLAMRRPGEGFGGFLAWNADENREMGWTRDPGFLAGAAGIGLALLAAATPVEPAWDRLLLVSIPQRTGG